MTTAWMWATVTGIAPLRVKIDGDTAALTVTPDSLIDPATLATGQRVRCELSEHRLIIHGAVGASTALTAYPVGAIYLSISPANPGTIFGGTWVAWGTGRVPVGVDTTQTEFSTVQKTGGEKAHSLTSDENGPHTHSVGGDGDTISSATHNYGEIVGGGGIALVNVQANYAAITGQYITTSGEGTAHNNLQPYITCYMWRRTA